MTPSLKISKNVIDRLLNINKKCFGKLYGVFYSNTLLVLGFNIENDKKSNILNSFPTEIDLCGILAAGDGTYEETTIKKLLPDIDVTDTPIYISCKLDNPNTITANFIINGRIEKANYQMMSDQDIYSQFIHVRLKTQLPLVCEPTLESLKEAFFNTRKLLSSGLMAFNIHKNPIYLVGNDNENGLVGLSGDPEIGAICEETGLTEGCGRKKKSPSFTLNVLTVNMFKRVTKDNSSIVSKQHAPIILVDKRTNKSEIMTLKIDALSLINRSTKLIKLYEILIESSVRNLKLLESCILRHVQVKNENDEDVFILPQPEIFHFYPESCGHFVTCIYPKNTTENDLYNERSFLHKQFLLPVNRPLFKKSNRYMFKEDLTDNGPLINTHESLNPSGNGGEVALVKGKYSYYHYCQNNMDDNGWGCAYRSLQTLASWYLWQGYTDKPVPTFNEIQKCLVDIEDKPQSFIGSKQWIGSTEVNFVLNKWLGVTSKILYISSGEEMSMKGPELLHHFQMQGSPVMIGGGVLAHTILGVDYNKQTGNIKFLILDPHYTGSEDLRIIQSKGWCGWKSVDFWDKNAYYNMCLPQVPVCI